METSKEQEEEAHAFLDRTSRPTRGKRMNKLLDEEIEEDELFWNQEALKDVLFSLSLSILFLILLTWKLTMLYM